MKTHSDNQAGIAHVAAIFVVLFMGVTGFAGYKVMTMDKAADGPGSSVTATADVPEHITTQADLTVTAEALDDSGAQLDGSLNDRALDADLNDML